MGGGNVRRLMLTVVRVWTLAILMKRSKTPGVKGGTASIQVAWIWASLASVLLHGLRKGWLAVDDPSWHQEYEAENRAKEGRRQEKYKGKSDQTPWRNKLADTFSRQAAKLNGPLEPLEGTWKVYTTGITKRSLNPYTVKFHRDRTKLRGAFRLRRVRGNPSHGPSTI